MPNESPSKLLKRTIALQQKLSSSSEFHEKRSISNLQDAVLEVKAVVENLNNIPGSNGTRIRIKKPWDRGSKWILTETQVNKAKGTTADKLELVPV